MTHPKKLNGSTLASAAAAPSAILRRGTARAAVDLFTAYGIDLETSSPAAEIIQGEVAFLSIGGFYGPLFSGFVVLGVSQGMLRRSNPTRSPSIDWIAELGNQLLGRIKNGLLREGIVIRRVPAALVQGVGSSMLCPRAGTAPVALSDGQDVVLIWTECEASFDPAEGWSLRSEEVLAEGDMLLF